MYKLNALTMYFLCHSVRRVFNLRKRLMLFYILPNCIKNLLAVIIRSELFCNITDKTYIINILFQLISDGINGLVLLYFFDN